MDFVAYSAFLKKRAKDFRGIASKTNGDMAVEDLHGEAWLVAEYHGAKRGQEIDWSDPADQSLVLGTLTVKHVWRPNAERECTFSADQERGGSEGSSPTFANLLLAEETADPLALLEHREEEEANKAKQEQEDAILESYSQSVAYNITLWHFNNIRKKAAAHLAINSGTLRNRIAVAAEILMLQPSVFDGVETIDKTFMPERCYGRPYWLPVKLQLDNAQWCWEFEEEITPVQSALSRLRHDELCEIVINGKTREARWHRSSRLFFFTDGNQPVFCSAGEVQEWRPASVKF